MKIKPNTKLKFGLALLTYVVVLELMLVNVTLNNVSDSQRVDLNNYSVEDYIY